MAKPKKPPAPINLQETHAQMAVDHSLNAAAVMEKFANTFGEQDAMALRQAIYSGAKEVQKDNLQECEAMLYGQALALQSMFMSLARRSQTQEYLKQYDLYFRLALKAQSQCRATLETLATLKSPPGGFCKASQYLERSATGEQWRNSGKHPSLARKKK